ncbi:MAG: T9SS type A sorting domain-containing protein [bacterium]|nr:T9SS type A sorting domain-containing protein [bacterium]
MKTNTQIFKIILVVLFLMSCDNSNSQGVTWGNILSYTNGSTLFKTCQTSDGGYIAVGTTRIGIDYKMFVIKLNQYGDSVWSRLYNLDIKAYYQSYWIEETYDKGFIVSGLGEGPNGDAYVIKLDASGNIRWVKVLSTSALDMGMCIKELPDKGFILLSRSDPFPSLRIVLTRLDSLGNIIWNKYYGSDDRGFEVEYIENSGFIIVGRRRNGSDFLFKSYLLRTDLNGDSLWSKEFTDFYKTSAYSIDVTADNGFIIGGTADTSNNLEPKAYIVKTDSIGNIQWQRRYGNGFNETCYSIRKFGNTKYVICGFSDSLQNAFERGVIRIIDLSGNVLQENYFRYGGLDNVFYSIERTNDNGLIVSGNSTTFNNVFSLLIKTDSIGNIYPVGINNSVKSIPNFQLYQNFPNPFNPTTTINFELSKEAMTRIVVYDVTGKIVSTLLKEPKKAGSYTIKFDGRDFPSGIYFYKLISGENVMVRRMVILK